MYYFRLFVFLLGLTAFGLLIMGLYRPRTVLWWEDVQNRRKVLRSYGVVVVMAFMLYLLLGLF